MAKSALLIPVAMPRENDVPMSALETIKCWGSASIYPQIIRKV
jgi:hypothetical protein